MGIIYRIALLLVIIGAVNWGLIGFFQFDLVAALFGGQDGVIARIVYSLVGISGLLAIPLLFKDYEEESDVSNEEYDKTYGNLNYQTEFGEENDFTDEKRKKALENYNDEDDDNNYTV